LLKGSFVFLKKKKHYEQCVEDFYKNKKRLRFLEVELQLIGMDIDEETPTSVKNVKTGVTATVKAV
jgi:hypothetical protein